MLPYALSLYRVLTDVAALSSQSVLLNWLERSQMLLFTAEDSQGMMGNDSNDNQCSDHNDHFSVISHILNFLPFYIRLMQVINYTAALSRLLSNLYPHRTHTSQNQLAGWLVIIAAVTASGDNDLYCSASALCMRIERKVTQD